MVEGLHVQMTAQLTVGPSPGAPPGRVILTILMILTEFHALNVVPILHPVRQTVKMWTVTLFHSHLLSQTCSWLQQSITHATPPWCGSLQPIFSCA